jgi:CBS domain-containing protein
MDARGTALTKRWTMTAISALMTRRGPLVTVGPDAWVGEANKTLCRAGLSHLLITGDGDRLLGVCCVCDLERAAAGARIRHLMHDELVTVESSTEADVALELMESHHVSCLPVVERGCLAGVITRHELQRMGIMGVEEEHCSACGSTEHVHCGHGHVRGLCLECARKSEPPDPDSEAELGGGD